LHSSFGGCGVKATIRPPITIYLMLLDLRLQIINSSLSQLQPLSGTFELLPRTSRLVGRADHKTRVTALRALANLLGLEHYDRVIRAQFSQTSCCCQPSETSPNHEKISIVSLL